MAIEHILIVILGICLIYSLYTLKCITSGSFRASSEERRDMYQQMERLLEKRETPSTAQVELSHVHAQERVGRVRQDAVTDREAIAKPGPKPIPNKAPIFSTGESGLGSVNT